MLQSGCWLSLPDVTIRDITWRECQVATTVDDAANRAEGVEPQVSNDGQRVNGGQDQGGPIKPRRQPKLEQQHQIFLECHEIILECGASSTAGDA